LGGDDELVVVVLLLGVGMGVGLGRGFIVVRASRRAVSPAGFVETAARVAVSTVVVVAAALASGVCWSGFSAGSCAEARQLDLWRCVVHLELAKGLVNLGEPLHGLVDLAVDIAAVGLVPVHFVLDLAPPAEVALVGGGKLVATCLRLERGKSCRTATFAGVV
jgi:hypothetical protein